MFRDGYLEIRVDKLGQVIARCWAEAESSLAELIALKHPNPPEELITELLAGESRHFAAVSSDSHNAEQLRDHLAEQLAGFRIAIMT